MATQLELTAGLAACGKHSQAETPPDVSPASERSSFQSEDSRSFTPATQDCCDVGAAVGGGYSDDAESFVPQPSLPKDFYARHLSSKPVFSEEYISSQDYFVRRALAATRANLVHLQPKVVIHDHTLEAALVLFKTYSADQNEAGQSIFQEDLYACIWLATKLLSMRTAAPNRQLVCMATSCDAEVLSWRELEVCKVLDWDMVEILREAGMI